MSVSVGGCSAASASTTSAAPTKAATASAIAASLPATTATTTAVALAMESVTADEAHRRLHRVGFARRARFGPWTAACGCTATRAETATAATKPAPACRGTRVLDKAFVKGLFQRVRNARVIDFFFEIWVRIGAVDGRAILLKRLVARPVLDAFFRRAIAWAAVVARLRALVVARFAALLVALIVALIVA